METRIDLRSPDAAANPYLVFAVCLAAGLDGINKKIYPTKSSSRELSETDQKTMKIENLPGNLNEAIDYFEQSDWIKEVLGTEFCKEYAISSGWGLVCIRRSEAPSDKLRSSYSVMSK